MDERLQWIEARISTSLKPRADEFKQLFENENSQTSFAQFFNCDEKREIYVYFTDTIGELLKASLNPPLKTPVRKFITFMKTGTTTKVNGKDIYKDIFYLEWSYDCLVYFEALTRCIFLPMLYKNESCEISCDRLMEVFHKIMANTQMVSAKCKGNSVLALPNMEVLTDAASFAHRRLAIIHILETTLIGWIKQIKNSLKIDIESFFKSNSGKFPQPSDELQFWEDRQARLNSLNEQLCSSLVISVITMLEECNSSYAQSFHSIKRNIAQADNEVNENLTFLKTIKSYLDFIKKCYDTEKLVCYFSPMMHTLLLIWTYSRYYHSPDNLNRLFNLISNMLVSKVQELVGTNILTNINGSENLHICLKVCAAFRGTYLDCKEKADAINLFKLDEQVGFSEDLEKVTWHSFLYRTARTPKGVGLFSKPDQFSNGNEKDLLWKDSPWPNRGSDIFHQLNLFMERCNDVLELVEVSYQFEKLRYASSVGAADTNSHNSQLVEIQASFDIALKTFNANVQDPLDIIKSQNFEFSFFEFRATVRELEMQLGAILSESLKSCWDIKSKLRLLDVFEGVTKRELVQNVLNQTLAAFVTNTKSEINAAEVLLNSGMTITSSHRFLPPVTNQIVWLRSIQKRVEFLLGSIITVAPMCLKGEAGWELKDLFVELKADLSRKESQILSKWFKSNTAALFDKFKEPLLIIDSNEKITVNFNEDLQACLREIHCLSTVLSIEYSQDVLNHIKYTHNEKLHSLVNRLNTAVMQYNHILINVSELEKVLLNDLLDEAYQVLSFGLNNLTWKDALVKDYIEKSVYTICDKLYQTFLNVKDNYGSIMAIVKSWTDKAASVFMINDMSQPLDVQVWHEKIVSFTNDSNHKIEVGSKQIFDCLEEIASVLKLNKLSPQWINYLNNVGESICDGVTNSIVVTLEYIYNKMVSSSLQSPSSFNPFLKVDMLLIGTSIVFSPPICETLAVQTLGEYIHVWVNSIVGRSKYLTPLTKDQCYESVINTNENIQILVQNIKLLSDEMILDCSEQMHMFKDYEFLWMNDVNHTFQEFSDGKLAPHFEDVNDKDCYEDNNMPVAHASFTSVVKIKSDFNERSSGQSSGRNTATTGLTSGVLYVKKNYSHYETEAKCKPDLNDFEKEIQIFQIAIQELLALPLLHNIGWIQINLQPIKHTITSYASKWMYTYTNYLSNQVETNLATLDMFLSRTEPEIENITGDETNITSVLKLMRVFNEITNRQCEVDEKFIEMKKTILVLEKFQQKLSITAQQFYAAAPARWNNLKMKVNQAKQKLGPRIQSEHDSVIKVLKEFREQCRNVWFEIEDSNIYSRDCDVSQAFLLIEQFNREVQDLEEESQDYIELQSLLEKNIVEFKTLTRMNTVLSYLKQVWETYKTIKDQHSEWKRHRWLKIKVKLLKRGLDCQYDMVMKLPDEAHGWDITLSMIEMINEIISCLPIMEDLGKAALRPRHWKQLIRVTGSIINTSTEQFSILNLKDFIELGLQHNAEEVRMVVKKSSKDIDIEHKLKLYEEVWISKVFETKRHSRLIKKSSSNIGNNSYAGSEFGGVESEFGYSSMSAMGVRRSQMSGTNFNGSVMNIREDPDRYLICNVEIILEELYSHQVSLQMILQHSSATSFIDDINKWQKTLQNIELIITSLLRIQEKWQLLDEVYSNSEMHISFAHESALFYTSSQEFHTIIKQIRKNPNVLQICSKSNLLHQIEKLTISIEQCDRVVRHYLERRRHRCPTLMLLSDHDAHAILCKGYDPTLLSPYLVNLFQSVKSLNCVVSAANVYEITSITSIFGEFVELVKPVVCENGVEYWLPHLQHSITLNLKLKLAILLGCKCELNDMLMSLATYKEEEQNPKELLQISNVKPNHSSSYLLTPTSHSMKDSVGKSYVFTYILKTILPLPDTWRFDSCTDAVELSVKYVTSMLAQKHLQAYVSINKNAISELLEKLCAAITSLSDFLLAQTKIRIHKKKLQKSDTAKQFDLDNIDISASVDSTKNHFDENDKLSDFNLDHDLKVYQINLLENLIQYFCVEQEFVNKIKNTLESGYNTEKGYPFEWLIHPKYNYNDKTGELHVAINDKLLRYEFEFQGAIKKNIVPLMQSRSLYWLVNSTITHDFGMIVTEKKNGLYDEQLKKSLCQLIGRQMFVYTCNPSATLDLIMNIFKGVLMTGSWITFANLSCLSSSMISFMGHQLQLIQTTLKEQTNTFTFYQDEITVCPSVMIFTNSYHTEKLPHTLKKCFRDINYTMPDFTILLKINLIKSAMIFATSLVEQVKRVLIIVKELFPYLSHGFNTKKILDLTTCFHENYKQLLKCKLGQKIVKELSSVRELSKINNTDAPLDTLAEQQNVSQNLLSKTSEIHSDTENKEEIERNLQYKSIIVALHQLFTPALSVKEITLFEEILDNEFKDINVYSLLEENIKGKDSHTIGVKLELEENEIMGGICEDVDSIFKMVDMLSYANGWGDMLTRKVNQICELTKHFNMVVVCGTNNSLSSTCIQLFLDAYKQYEKTAQTHTIYMGAMESNELFGYFQKETRQWQEGIFPMVVKQTNEESYHFIVLANKVTADQEAMLNQLATCNGSINLANGESLLIPSNVKFIWQVSSLSDVPSGILPSVSIIHVDGDDLTIDEQIRSFFNHKPISAKDYLISIFKNFIGTTINFFLQEKIDIGIRLYDIVSSILKIFNSISSHVQISSDYDNYVNYAVFWTYSSYLSHYNKSMFSQWWKTVWSMEVSYPGDKEVWNYFVNPDSHLFTDIEDSLYFSTLPHSNMFVHSLVTMSTSYLLHSFLNTSQSFFLFGNCGSGKSAILRKQVLLHKSDGGDFDTLFIDVNEFLSCEVIWSLLNEVMDWKHSTFYLPSGDKKLICVVEDMHLCETDEFGLSPVCELIHQLIIWHGAYNPARKQWQEFGDIVFIVTYDPHYVTLFATSLQSLVNCSLPKVQILYPNTDDQCDIFYTLLLNHLIQVEDQQLFFLDEETLTIDKMKRKREILELEKLLKMIVTVTIELQEKLKEMFLGTLERNHYVFTLKNLHSLFSRFCLTLSHSWEHEHILKAWFYELHWSYACLLIDTVDYSRWQQAVFSSMKKTMNGEQMELVNKEVPVFTTLQLNNGLPIKASFTEVPSAKFHSNYFVDELQSYLETKLSEYNKDNQPMKINYFEENVRLTFRLLQTLQSPFACGHTIILNEGTPGTTMILVQQACSLANIQCVSINTSSIINNEKYSIDQFKVDYMQVLLGCGLKDLKKVLLLTEIGTVSPHVYVLIDELLQHGNMSHLFTAEDKIYVINSIRTSGDQEMAHFTQIEAWDYFITNIHKNFHFFGIISSKETMFQKIAAKHASLMASVDIIIINHWSKAQLVENSRFIIKNELKLDSCLVDNLSHLFAMFHLQLQRVNRCETYGPCFDVITNTNFEFMVERFCCLYKTKHEKFVKQKKLLELTLESTKKSAHTNTQYEKKLEHEQIVYTQKCQGCDTLLTQIGQDQAITDEQVRLVKKTKQRISKLEKLLPEYEEAHKRSVFKAAAIVKETKEIVISLEVKGISELRAMQKPGSEIEDLLAAIVIIVKSPTSDLTWHRGAKRIMANVERFKEEMLSFDEIDLSESTLQVLQAYIDRPHFAPMYLGERNHNQAIDSLVLYVRGVVRYNMLMQTRVKPYVEKVNHTTQLLREVKQKLDVMQHKLNDLHQRLHHLSSKYEEAVVDKVEQCKLIASLEISLRKATQFEQTLLKLISIWKSTLMDIKKEDDSLLSGLILSCAFSVYMGPYTHSFRETVVMQHWLSCLNEQGMTLNCPSFLNECGNSATSPSYYRVLLIIFQHLFGKETCKHLLTADYNINEFENLILLQSTCRKRALLVSDPDDQLSKLLQQIQLYDQQITVLDVRSRDNNFLSVFERSISSGALLVLENVDDTIDCLFHSTIEAIMTNISCQTEKRSLKFNGHRVKYDSRFQLLFVSKLKQPSFHRDFLSLCTYVNMALVHQDMRSKISQLILLHTQPSFQQDLQMTYYNAWTCSKHLHLIDESIILKFHSETDLQSIWSEKFDAITNLVQTREMIHEKEAVFKDQLKYLHEYIESNIKLCEPLDQLFTLAANLHCWNKQYLFTSKVFMDILNDCLQNVYGSQKYSANESFVYQDVQESLLADTSNFEELTSEMTEYSLIKPQLMKSCPMLGQSEKFKIITTFSPVFLKFFRKYNQFNNSSILLSPNDFQCFFFIHDVLTTMNKWTSDMRLQIKVFFNALYHSLDNKLVSLEFVNIPKWVPLFSRRVLSNLVKSYAEMERVVKALENSSLQTWHDTAYPENTIFPIESCSPFLKLLTIKALRPDRFYCAMICYWNEHFSSPVFLEEMSHVEALNQLTPSRPVIIVKDTRTCDAMQVVTDHAKVENMQVDVVRIRDASDYDIIDVALTSIVQSNTYLVVESLNITCTEELFVKLYYRCNRLQRQYEDSKWRIFILVESCENMDEAFITFCHVVSLASLCNEAPTKDLKWIQIVQRSILDSLKILLTARASSLVHFLERDRKLMISICIFHAYMQSSFLIKKKITNEMLLSALDYAIKEVNNNKSFADNKHVEEIEVFLSKILYSCPIDHASETVNVVVRNIITVPITEGLPEMCIENFIVPFPKPVSMELAVYIEWLNEQFNKDDDVALEEKNTWFNNIKEVNKYRSDMFSEKLCSMFMKLRFYDERIPCVDDSKILNDIIMVNENLPEALPSVETVNTPLTGIYSFFKEEFRLFNTQLAHVRNTLTALNAPYVERSASYTKSLESIIRSLLKGTTPKEWMFENFEDIEDISLSSWLKDFKHRRSKLDCLFDHEWLRLRSPINLKDLSLRVFVRCPTLFYLLKYMKAMQAGVNVEQIHFVCAFDNLSTRVEEDVGSSLSIATHDLWIQNAFVRDNKYIVYEASKSTTEKLPQLVITPDLILSTENLKCYHKCPLFVNQNCVDVITYLYLPMEVSEKGWRFNNINLFSFVH